MQNYCLLKYICKLSTLKGSQAFRLVVVLCGYGQSVEEDQEHHHPIKRPGFHVHQALHPEETVPTPSQAAKHKNNSNLLFHIECQHLEIFTVGNSLVIDYSTLALQVIQTVCV